MFVRQIDTPCPDLYPSLGLSPLTANAGDQPHLAVIQVNEQAIAVELDLGEPAVTRRKIFDELRKLRRLALRHRAALGGWRRRPDLGRYRDGGSKPSGVSASIAAALTPGRSNSWGPSMSRQVSCRLRSRRRNFTWWKRPFRRCPSSADCGPSLRIRGREQRVVPIAA